MASAFGSGWWDAPSAYDEAPPLAAWIVVAPCTLAGIVAVVLLLAQHVVLALLAVPLALALGW